MTVRISIVGALCCALCTLAPLAAAAQAPARVVILPKHTVDGKLGAEGAVEAAVAEALKQRGVRIVDLDAAMSAQRTAFSDSVLAGKIPTELSVLNADVVGSYQLTCDKSTDSTFGTKLKGYYCVLSTKLIRIDSGDVVFSANRELTGHGLNAGMAVQQVVKQLGAQVVQGAESWLAQLAGQGPWDVDLAVVGLENRAKAQELAKLLGATQGVSARLVLFQPRLTKYVLSGTDGRVLEGLADALEANQGLPLQITYQAGRVLHAQFDFGKAYRLGALALSVGPAKDPGGESRAQAADLLVSELGNLPYLDLVAPYRPASTTPDAQAKREQALLRTARERGVPLLLVSSLLPQGAGYSCALKLLSARADGRVIAAADGQAAEPGGAIEAARRGLDDAFRRALGTSVVQADLGLSPEATRAAVTQGLHIESFTAVPGGSDGARARLVVRNVSQRPIDEGTLTFQATDAVLEQRQLKALGAGDTTTIEAPLSGLPTVGDSHMEIAAIIAYRDGEVFRRVRAVATVIPPRTGLPAPYRAALIDAWKAIDEGAYARALDLAKKAHDLAPTAKAQMVRGIAELGLANYRKALGHFEDALGAARYKLQSSDRQLVQRAIVAAKKQLGEGA